LLGTMGLASSWWAVAADEISAEPTVTEFEPQSASVRVVTERSIARM